MYALSNHAVEICDVPSVRYIIAQQIDWQYAKMRCPIELVCHGKVPFNMFLISLRTDFAVYHLSGWLVCNVYSLCFFRLGRLSFPR